MLRDVGVKPKLVAGALGVLIIALIAAACGGGATATPPPTASQPAAAATKAPQGTPTPQATSAPTPVPRPTAAPTPTPVPIKRGGVMASSILAEPPPWNILQGPITNSFPLFQPVLSSLVQFDMVNRKIVGDLAQSWDVSSDGTKITFHLRDGVTWHDGTALKASDVKFNLDAVFFATLGFSSHLKGFFNVAKSVEASDDRTVVITLTQPSNSFFSHLTHGMMVNYPPQVSQDDLKTGKVIGTNAFTWSKYEKGVKLEERAYPKYWDKGLDGGPLPYLDGIDWFVISDTATSVAAFRTGKVDLFDPLNGTALTGHIDELKSAIPGLITATDLSSWRMILINSKPPLDNVNLRKAIQIGIDRTEFVTVGLQGLGVPAGFVMKPGDSGGLWGSTLAQQKTLPGLNADNHAQDIATAAQLLKQAGYDDKNPVKLTMNVLSISGFSQEATVIATELNKIKGFQITIEPESVASEAQRLVVGGNFQIIYRAFAIAVDDPADTIGTFWTSNAPRNYPQWIDDTVDKLYNEQETTSDAAKRRATVQQLEARIYDQAYNVVAGWGASPWAINPKTKNVFRAGPFTNTGRYDKTWLD